MREYLIEFPLNGLNEMCVHLHKFVRMYAQTDMHILPLHNFFLLLFIWLKDAVQ